MKQKIDMTMVPGVWNRPIEYLGAGLMLRGDALREVLEVARLEPMPKKITVTIEVAP